MKGWTVHDGGAQPAATKGKRVTVQLRSGRVAGDKPVNSDSKLGWAADECRWKWEPQGSATRHVDIVRYMIL